MKNLILLAAVICFGVAVLKLVGNRMRSTSQGSPAAGNREPWRTVPAQEAAPLLEAEGTIVLDVRTQEEYDGGHIPGAVCLPVESIGTQPPASLPDPDAEILVYCRSGRRSAQAAGKLAKLGYTNVSDFGGILNWPYETTTD